MSYLEDCLYGAILDDNRDAIKLFLSQGANPNEVTSNGRTCLGEAVLIGNLNVLKILLDEINPRRSSIKHDISSIDEDTRTKYLLRYKFGKASHKIRDPCTSSTAGVANSGYFIYIHEDKLENNKDTINSKRPIALPKTPSPQDDLEWDEDLGKCAPVTKEDETWSSMYKWYATVLESTGVVWQSEVFCGIDQQDAMMKTALHYAAERCDVSAMKMLIDAGCKLDIEAEKGITPLQAAVLKNHNDIVEVLVASGSRVNHKTHVGLTALHMAATQGHLQIVRTLVKAGACLEARDITERTPLYLASRSGHVDVVRFLIAAGAYVNTEDSYNFTPLCEAVWKSNSNLVDLLLQSGARITHSQKLLHYSVMEKEEEMVRLLVSTQLKSVINIHDYQGNTPLMLSVINLQPHISKLLLDQGANVDLCNSVTGESVLHVAMQNVDTPERFEEFLLLFLNYKVCINSIALTKQTPLRSALLFGKDEAASLLIKHGADVNTYNATTPFQLDNLTVVWERNSIDLALLLIKAGHRILHNHLSSSKVRNQTIQQMCSSPLTLKDLCRIKIRCTCKNNILYKSIDVLPIPNPLKGFLMFEYL